MWQGYFEIGDVEFINVARTEAYAERAGLSWFRPIFKCDGLRQVLGDDPYVDPVTDLAPWYDPRIPHSADFYGVYPLDVAGLNDATTTTGFSENVGDGASGSAVRRASGAGVFTVLLIAASDAGADFGKTWLTRALLGPCGTDSGCDGLTLAYMAAEPVVGPWRDAQVCSDRRAPRSADPLRVAQLLGRTRRNTQVTTPLQITATTTTSDKGAVWNGTFTLGSGNPYEFGQEVSFIENWFDPGESSIWPTGVAPAGASVSGPVTYAEEECLPLTYTPLYDPLCPGVVPPPVAPNIDWECYEPPASWQRYKVIIPETFIPGFTEVNPIFTFAAATTEARRVRVRIYADPLKSGDLDPLQPCDFVADFVVAYIPAEHTMTFDGVDKIVYVDSPEGVRRRADNLVFASDGGPFDWPSLTCGQQYVMFLDADTTETKPFVSLALVERMG